MKAIDPLKVSQLNESEYLSLLEYSGLINSGTKAENIPDVLRAQAFMAMRNSGYKVKFPSDMFLAAHNIQSQKLIIESLRKFNGSSLGS